MRRVRLPVTARALARAQPIPLDDARSFVIRHLPIFLLAALGAVASAAAADPPAWRSAFEGYQPFADPAPVAWPQANDTVRQVGGWRAYAREAAQPASAAASAPQPKAGATGAHGAHHKP